MSIEGYVRCPFTNERSPVMRNKRNRLYYHNAGVGPANLHGHAFQEWIVRNLEPAEESPQEPSETNEMNREEDL